MAELVVIGYPDVETAQKALDTVHQLEKDLTMQTGGAAVVRRTPEGKVEMVTKTGATSAGAAMGGFWGLLFGLLFLIPGGGLVSGGLMGGLMGTMSGWGIRDEFRSGVADVLKPGGSALVLFVAKAHARQGARRARAARRRGPPNLALGGCGEGDPARARRAGQGSRRVDEARASGSVRSAYDAAENVPCIV